MKPNPFTRTALTIGLLSVMAGIALGIVEINLADDYFGNPSMLAALAAWSNYLLALGVLAIFAATTIAGVAWELRRRSTSADN